jgi:hypothetical protein
MARVRITLTLDLRRTLRNVQKAHEYLDNQVVKRTEPYTPKITGTLIKSSQSTQAGKGKIIWSAPYAKDVYYRAGAIGRPSGALRGYRWFDRMMVDQGAVIIKNTKKIAGGGRV